MPTAVMFAVLAGALMIAQQVVAKAARDTLFLSSFPASALPVAMIVAAVMSLPIVLGGSALLARLGPARVMPTFLTLNGLAFALEWFLLPRLPRGVAAAAYLHVAMFGGLSVSGFWSVVNEHFDPHEARRAVGWIALGSALGGLFGGMLAVQLAGQFGVRTMLLALTPIMLAAALILVRFRAQAVAGDPADIAEPQMSGLRTLASSPYLRSLATVMVVAGTSAAALDYSFKSSAAATLGQPERLAEFFSAYYMAVSVVTVLLQGTLSRFSLDRFGLGVTLAVLPAALLLGAGASAAVGGLWSIVVLRGAEAALGNSFFRSAYEPLYTPLPPQKKRASKAIIDVAADRVGDAVGSLAILLFLALLPEQIRLAALGIVVLGALTSLWLAHKLQRGYIDELANSLRKGLVRLSPQEIGDKTTRLTLSRTHGEIDREAILREVETLRRGHRPEPELARSAAELTSGDGARIRAVLEQPLDRRLLSFVVPMLEFDELREPVTRALTSIANNAVGQLGDSLLDPDLPPKARQRIPALLAGIGGQRAVRALTEGLFANEFALRESSARALLGLRRRDPSWRPPETLLVSIVRRELETRAGMARPEPNDVESKDDLPVINAPSENRMLRHVFTLLALALEPESVELSLRALAAGDPKLRGTALEYLENVIPGELRAELWPHLSDHRQGSLRAPRRSNQELAEELKRSFSG